MSTPRTKTAAIRTTCFLRNAAGPWMAGTWVERKAARAHERAAPDGRAFVESKEAKHAVLQFCGIGDGG